jgi:hypothetical protein
MKINLTIVLLILFTISSYGQLQVNAGGDKNICLDDGITDTIRLGGNPTASGGDEPYIYKWSTDYSFSNHSWRASYYLDDSTTANPRLSEFPADSLKFILTVTDFSGNQATYSVIIRSSYFIYGAMEIHPSINQGDTITLSTDILGGFEPFYYSWAPNYHISDTSICNPEVWPDNSTNYTVITRDKFGCPSYPSTCYVTVTPSGNRIPEGIITQAIVFPDPINNSSVIFYENPAYKRLKIRTYNANGGLIFAGDFKDNYCKIGEIISVSGTYFYIIISGSEVMTYGKFLKK